MAKSVTISSIKGTDASGNVVLTTVHRGGLANPDGDFEIQRANVIDVIEVLIRIRPDLADRAKAIASQVMREVDNAR
jgi:hypothetical protein